MCHKQTFEVLNMDDLVESFIISQCLPLDLFHHDIMNLWKGKGMRPEILDGKMARQFTQPQKGCDDMRIHWDVGLTKQAGPQCEGSSTSKEKGSTDK